MELIIEQLATLGLNEKQAKCYLALTELGQATAYQVALKAKLKRPITYIVLDELRRKGLALKVPHPKKQLFIAKSPDEFFTEYEEKFRNAKRMLPELLAAAMSKKKKVRVLYYEGKEGISEALQYKMQHLTNKELLAFFGGKSTPSKPVAPLYLAHSKKMFEQGNRTRAFAPRDNTLKEFRSLDKKYDSKIVQLSQSEYSSRVSIDIIDTFVRIMLHKDSQVVIIDNPDFVNTMREIFEIVWKAKRSR